MQTDKDSDKREWSILGKAYMFRPQSQIWQSKSKLEHKKLETKIDKDSDKTLVIKITSLSQNPQYDPKKTQQTKA